jgi:hypothetical protein
MRRLAIPNDRHYFGSVARDTGDPVARGSSPDMRVPMVTGSPAFAGHIENLFGPPGGSEVLDRLKLDPRGFRFAQSGSH